MGCHGVNGGCTREAVLRRPPGAAVAGRALSLSMADDCVVVGSSALRIVILLVATPHVI